jgi:uncharacterized protein YeeX (DUF496 family)
MKRSGSKNGKGSKATGMKFDAAIQYTFEHQMRRKNPTRAEICEAFKKARNKRNRKNGKGSKASGMEFDARAREAAVLYAFERQMRRKNPTRAELRKAFKKARDSRNKL